MKTMRIQIKNRKEFREDLLQIARKIDRGVKIKPVKGVFFESLEAVRNVLTEKRLEVWRTIRDRKPQSISELAKLLNRGFRIVHSDVQLLVAVGLIALKEEAGLRGRRQRPTSLADKVEFQVA